MAFTSLFPTNGSGGGFLNSLANSAGGLTSARPVIGIGSNLLSASFAAQSQQSALRALSLSDRPSAFDLSGLSENAVSLPRVGEATGESLNRRVNDIRSNPTFIDLNDSRLRPVSNDGDRQTTFALTIALDRLRSLAELSADRSTTDATRRQLDSLFRQGLEEVQNFIREADTNLLALQYGSRSSRSESTVSLGRNQSDFDGALIVDDPDAVISNLAGNERFTISLSNTSSGLSDDLTIDLSDVSGDLTLNSIVSHINTQIAGIQATDSNGDIVLDGNGDPISRYQTEFDIRSSGNRFGLQVDATITERVSLSAAEAAPSIYVASTIDPVDAEDTSRARVTSFTGLDGTLTQGQVISFAATNIEETLLAEETNEALIPEDEIDGNIAARRDQFREQAATAVAEANGTSEDNEDDTAADDILNGTTGVNVPITNIIDDSRVQAETSASRIATDSQGNIIVVGTSSGSFGSEINTSDQQDVFVTKLDNQGNVLFSRLLGAADQADAFSVTVDANDNIIVAGQTNSPLTNTDLLDTSDAFVVKFDSSGDEQFRFQLDTFGATSGIAVVTNDAGDIFVGGASSGSINSSSRFQGATDGLLLRLDGTTGALEDSLLLGTSGRDVVKGLAFAEDGDLLVASEENGFATVRKLDSNDFRTENASFTLGALGNSGSVQALTVDGDSVFVAGVTQNGSLTGAGSFTQSGVAAGSIDGFVTGITVGANSLTGSFTQLISTSAADRIVDITAQDGSVFVAGTTGGVFDGEDSAGARDSFITRLNGQTGTVEDTQQFGVSFTNADAGGIAFTSRGQSVLNTLGLPSGNLNEPQSRTLTDQTSVRVGDFFSLEVAGRSTDIIVEEGDTFTDIRRKIRVAALGQVKVTVSESNLGDGEDIRIEALREGLPITLTPGRNGKDALERLGIEAGTLIPTSQLFRDLDDPDAVNQLGGSFGLGIDLPINISDLTNATFSLEQIDDAIRTVGRAFRSLRPNPLAGLLNDPLNNIGPPPPRIAAQIANFQTALQRLQSSNPSTGISLFT